MPSSLRPPVLAWLVAVFAAGCTPTGDAWAACNQVAPNWQGATVGAFPTTLGRVRALGPAHMTDRWNGLPDAMPAAVCYIDGSIPKAPPGGEPFDRAVVAIVNGHADLLMAGYRATLPITAP